MTEYADKELYEILGKAGRLSEQRAQVIACDLVSALYYLHSNRVLHRFDILHVTIFLNTNIISALGILNHKMYFLKAMEWQNYVILDLLAV